MLLGGRSIQVFWAIKALLVVPVPAEQGVARWCRGSQLNGVRCAVIFLCYLFSAHCIWVLWRRALVTGVAVHLLVPSAFFCCHGGSLQMVPSAVSQAIFTSVLAQFCFSERRLHSFWNLFCVSDVGSSRRVNLVFWSKQIQLGNGSISSLGWHFWEFPRNSFWTTLFDNWPYLIAWHLHSLYDATLQMPLNLNLESCISSQCSISAQGCCRANGGRYCRMTKAFCFDMHLCSQKWGKNLGKLGEGLQVQKNKPKLLSYLTWWGSWHLKGNQDKCFLF